MPEAVWAEHSRVEQSICRPAHEGAERRSHATSNQRPATNLSPATGSSTNESLHQLGPSHNSLQLSYCE
jgi:hypothetical protein